MAAFEGVRQKEDVVEVSQGESSGLLLFYSREVPPERDEKLPKRDQGRKIEYFILTRDPEKPIADHEVTGQFLRNATECPTKRAVWRCTSPSTPKAEIVSLT